MNDVEKKVRGFIEHNFLVHEDRAPLSDVESLIGSGLIDSTGILELVAFLESEFDIRMADAEIAPADLDSIKAIVAYIERKGARSAA